ncbi:HTH-type transcriptional activator RhaS [Nocardia sp. RB20]|uniref:HTH-type transcriptional activator RhaS n=2 Tax=Nocardia macrotermitis TaxID=2585198 RepID=A0A7K0D1N2_9NOCA|nr:HTH-type transcriptional activator RhaS [Nocardia macrotermitis]
MRVGSANSRVIRHSGGRGLRFAGFAGSGFHIVLRGTCWLITEHQQPVELHPGDVVLAPSGAEHGLSNRPCALRELSVLMPVQPSPEPADFEFLCGAYRLTHGNAPQYLRSLPGLLTVSLDYERHPQLNALIELLEADVSSAVPGAGATVPALLDLILVHVLRRWHELNATEHAAPADTAIAAAVQQIHAAPQHQWTVARLSEAAGLPRTSFTRRFTEALGQPPMRYVTGLRLNRGAQLLRESDAPLATIAREVGYATEFAFAGAFRREYGISPGRFRRSGAAPVRIGGMSEDRAHTAE